MNARGFVGLGVVLTCATTGLVAADWPELTGPYLDQRIPRGTPEIFAPGVISHGFHELGITFSPDGNEIFYIMSDGRYQHYVLLHLDRYDGRWSEPEVADFAAHLSPYSVSFGPDGDTVFFTGRPPAGSPEPRAEHDIFRVRRIDGRWGRAENLGQPVNTKGPETSISVAADGTLYFARDDANGSSDLWVARPKGESFDTPERIGSPVNTTSEEARPFIARDQDYLVFHSNREGSLGSMDLFVSVRADDGSWREPVSLGPEINSTASEFGPSVTSNGRFLFFSSYRGVEPEVLNGKGYRDLLGIYRQPVNGYATLYWVDAGGFLPVPGE